MRKISATTVPRGFFGNAQPNNSGQKAPPSSDPGFTSPLQNSLAEGPRHRPYQSSSNHTVPLENVSSTSPRSNLTTSKAWNLPRPIQIPARQASQAPFTTATSPMTSHPTSSGRSPGGSWLSTSPVRHILLQASPEHDVAVVDMDTQTSPVRTQTSPIRITAGRDMQTSPIHPAAADMNVQTSPIRVSAAHTQTEHALFDQRLLNLIFDNKGSFHDLVWHTHEAAQRHERAIQETEKVRSENEVKHLKALADARKVYEAGRTTLAYAASILGIDPRTLPPEISAESVVEIMVDHIPDFLKEVECLRGLKKLWERIEILELENIEVMLKTRLREYFIQGGKLNHLRSGIVEIAQEMIASGSFDKDLTAALAEEIAASTSATALDSSKSGADVVSEELSKNLAVRAAEASRRHKRCRARRTRRDCDAKPGCVWSGHRCNAKESHLQSNHLR